MREQPWTIREWVRMAVSQENCVYKNRQWAGFGSQATVCQSQDVEEDDKDDDDDEEDS